MTSKEHSKQDSAASRGKAQTPAANAHSAGDRPSSGQPRARTVSPEEREKAMERLYVHPLKTLLSRHEDYINEVAFRISRENVPAAALTFHNESAEKHLYYEPMKRKTEMLKKLEEKFDPRKEYTSHTRTRRAMSPEDLSNLGKRLCTDSMEHKRRLLEEAEKKAYKYQERKTLGPEARKAMAARLHDACCEKKKDSLARLEEKYTWKREKKIGTATPETWDRLSKKTS